MNKEENRTYEVKVHCINCGFNGVVQIVKGCSISDEPCPCCECRLLKMNITVTW